MRRYRYVGPSQVRDAVLGQPLGLLVTAAATLEATLRQLRIDEGAPGTFVVDLAGRLRIADRSSEHVACAGGEDVLAAGELAFERGARGWRVSMASNQSTGYCPEPACWEALATALDAVAIAHDAGFTHAFEFRRCPNCAERNLVKDEHFVCDACGATLPATWNFGA